MKQFEHAEKRLFLSENPSRTAKKPYAEPEIKLVYVGNPCDGDIICTSAVTPTATPTLTPFSPDPHLPGKNRLEEDIFDGEEGTDTIFDTVFGGGKR